MSAKPVEQLWKFQVQHKKKPDVDTEAFYKWYKDELMPECIRLVKKYNIPRYSVFFTPPAVRQPWRDDFENRLQKPHWSIPDWDATTCYWVRDPEDLKQLQADPEWTSRVNAMEEPWIASAISISIGYETIYFEDGTVMNTTVATD
ncbi:hypothetical protein Hte_008874 [Hypoxylon texense]